MFRLDLPRQLEKKLEAFARGRGLTESRCACEAIRQFLEDREDYLEGVAALERREPTITLQELERRLEI